jgi:hypothetical protein
MQAYKGIGGIVPFILKLSIIWRRRGQLHVIAALLPVTVTRQTHCIGGWVGPIVGLDTWGKISCPCRESNNDSLIVCLVV